MTRAVLAMQGRFSFGWAGYLLSAALVLSCGTGEEPTSEAASGSPADSGPVSTGDGGIDDAALDETLVDDGLTQGEDGSDAPGELPSSTEDDLREVDSSDEIADGQTPSVDSADEYVDAGEALDVDQAVDADAGADGDGTEPDLDDSEISDEVSADDTSVVDAETSCSDCSDASEASDVSDVSDASDATDVSDASDASDVSDVSDAGGIECEDLDSTATPGCDDSGCGVCPATTECVDDRGCFTEAVNPGDYAPSMLWAYVAQSELGSSIPTEESFTEDQVRRGESGGVCCFDIDGDGAVDNGAAAFNEAVFALSGDTGELVMAAIMDEDLSLLVEYRSVFTESGQASLHFFSGTNDLDHDGVADQDYDTRAEGSGSFWILPESFGPRGSRAQLNRGTWARPRGRFDGLGESPFLMPAAGMVFGLNPGSLFSAIGFGSLGTNLSAAAEVQGLRIEADFDVGQPNRTENENLVIDDEELTVGGLRIGGYVLLDDVLPHLAVTVESCTCAIGDTTGAPPSLIYGEGANPRRPTRYGVICNDTTFDISACESGETICDRIGLICSTGVQILTTLPLGDLDTNGNGINDAMSFGSYLTLVPATIAAGTFAPAD